jgi:ferritin-like metal-binding protein YciE
MAEVEDARALLLMAVQDLFDAEAAMVERLPVVRSHVRDEALAQLIERDEAHSKSQRDTLGRIARELGAEGEGERNIWQRAILDDADNDARTIAPGPLLDIALRKGKQSERVSYETALALAGRLGLEEARAALTAVRDEEQAMDEALAEVLARVCGGLAAG